jgi:hypothetical protein
MFKTKRIVKYAISNLNDRNAKDVPEHLFQRISLPQDERAEYLLCEDRYVCCEPIGSPFGPPKPFGSCFGFPCGLPCGLHYRVFCCGSEEESEPTLPVTSSTQGDSTQGTGLDDGKPNTEEFTADHGSDGKPSPPLD